MEETVHDRIIRLIQEHGVDEVYVAQKIGKDKSTIYRITNKTSMPSKTTVKLIADAFGVDYSELLTGKKQQTLAGKTSDSPWKDEAYTNVKDAYAKATQQIEYLQKKYDQLFEAVVSGKLGKLLALKLAGELPDDATELAMSA